MPSSMFGGSHTLDNDLNRAVANASNNLKQLSSDASELLSNLNGINDLNSPGDPYTIGRENNEVYDMRSLYFETLSFFSSVERIVIRNKKEGVGDDNRKPPKKYYKTLKEDKSIRADTANLLQKIYQYKTALKQLNTTGFENDEYTLQCFEKTKELMRLVDYLISPMISLGKISDRLTNNDRAVNVLAILAGAAVVAASITTAGGLTWAGGILAVVSSGVSKAFGPAVINGVKAGPSTLISARKIKRYIIHGHQNLAQDIQRFANGNRKKLDALKLLEDISDANANVGDIPNNIFHVLGNRNEHRGLVWLLNEILTKKRFDYLNEGKLLLDVDLLNNRNADVVRVFRSLFGANVQIDNLSEEQIDDLNKILRYLSETDIDNVKLFRMILKRLTAANLSRVSVKIFNEITNDNAKDILRRVVRETSDYLPSGIQLEVLNTLSDRNANAEGVLRAVFNEDIRIDSLSENQMKDLSNILRYLSDINNESLFAKILELFDAYTLSEVSFKIFNSVTDAAKNSLKGAIITKSNYLPDHIQIDILNMLHNRGFDFNIENLFQRLSISNAEIGDLSENQLNDLNKILRYLSDIRNNHMFSGILGLLSISQLSTIKNEIRSNISQRSLELLVGALNQKKQALSLSRRLWHIRS